MQPRSLERPFVPATLSDNPHLDREQYERTLDKLDPYTRAMLKLRAGRLAPQLARHGIAIDHAALADPQRRLIDTRIKPADSAVAARLHRVLDELQRRLPQPA